MNEPDLTKINQHIADRSDVFYWQTDRAVEPADAGHIWADRHRYFTDAAIMERVNDVLGVDKLVAIQPFNADAQTNLGNVNSVRQGTLASGKKVILRCHPRGLRNGYFYAESAAAARAKAAGLPSYDTLVVHEYEDGDDFAFQVIEQLPGTAIQPWLREHPGDEAALLPRIGAMMARLHTIKVKGFGPFDNAKAKSGHLVGLHKTFRQAVQAGLSFNLQVLQKEGVVSEPQASAITKLYAESPLLNRQTSVLVHNDFADWNLLTDGRDVTGMLDWDECVAGDPISDIACWSTFFEPKRMHGFLQGYWQVATKPADFDDAFELLRLRYTLSKMTLRIRRYHWEPTDEIKRRIEVGKTHLAASFGYFGL